MDRRSTTVINGLLNGDRIITSYFRYTLNVAAGDTELTNLSMNLIRDDGQVVYLNGTEISRQHARHAGGQHDNVYDVSRHSHENALDVFPVPAGVLHDGTNTLAVEIHQRGTDSSDVSFDLTFSHAIGRWLAQ